MFSPENLINCFSEKNYYNYKEVIDHANIQMLLNNGILVSIRLNVGEENGENLLELIDELNSYGFDFKYTDLGLDKLRTLYYKEEKYSKNQNG